MGQPNAIRFRHEPVQAAVAVEAPGASLLDDLDPRLVVAVQKLIGDLARGSLYVSSSASDPNHCTLTTTTRQSGRMPRTEALGLRSSSLLIDQKSSLKAHCAEQTLLRLPAPPIGQHHHGSARALLRHAGADLRQPQGAESRSQMLGRARYPGSTATRNEHENERGGKGVKLTRARLGGFVVSKTFYDLDFAARRA